MGDLQRWCTSKVIRLEYMAPHSPAQNSVAERMNHTLAKLSWAMILSSKALQFIWLEVIAHAAYLHN